MSEQSVEIAKSALSQARPWRKGMPWWIVVLEGVLALGLGIYIMTQPAASGQIVLLLALYLLIVNAERAWLGFRSVLPPAILAERMLRAGIGITVGLIILLDAWQPFMNPPAPVVILSLGWLLIGLIGIWEWVAAHNQLGLGWGALISPSVFTLFGLLMLGSRTAMGALLLQWIGILAVVAGAALLLYGFYLYRRPPAAPAYAAAAGDVSYE